MTEGAAPAGRGLAFALGLILGPLGALVVHVLCRRVQQQWLHLLAAAVVGGLGVYLAALGFGERPRDWDRLAIGVGTCTALARMALIPYVPAVIARFPAGTPSHHRFSLR